jgi:hypothetical protein
VEVAEKKSILALWFNTHKREDNIKSYLGKIQCEIQD